MKINDITPCSRLHPFINRFWIWENELNLPIMMLPGTGTELIIQYQGDPISVFSDDLRPIHTVSRSMLVQPRYNRFFLKNTTPVSFISIRFRHGTLRHFTNIPIIELIDLPLKMQEIWSNDGQEIEETIQKASSIQQKKTILEQFLLQQFNAYNSTQHPWLPKATQQLYYQKQPDLTQIIDESNISHRYFEKIFKINCGVSPKHFQCIARFQKTIRSLLLNQNTDYLSYALDQGYYDQAHFIKTFKNFTHCTPLNYLNPQNFTTHFYNQPL